MCIFKIIKGQIERHYFCTKVFHLNIVTLSVPILVIICV